MSTEITAEMVLQVAAYNPEVAERIAAYASLRFAGWYRQDACREIGIDYDYAQKYEHAINLLRARFDLPEPIRAGEQRAYGDPREHARSGAHQYNHVSRGITSPDCLLCRGGAV